MARDLFHGKQNALVTHCTLNDDLKMGALGSKGAKSDNDPRFAVNNHRLHPILMHRALREMAKNRFV